METSKTIILNEIIAEDCRRLTQQFLREITDRWEGSGMYAVYIILALNRKWAEYVIRN